jgi:hypothetical protein
MGEIMERCKDIKKLPFELAYLALLTKSGIKRLSRWEAPLSDLQRDTLLALDLHIQDISRSTLLGRRVPRIVFSTQERLTSEYRKRFDKRRLSNSSQTVRTEGWFFGYPSCCVEQFVRKQYVCNNLPPEDQRILFHWACPDCHTTESLVREYRLIHNECTRAFGGVTVLPDFNCRFPGLHDRQSSVRLRKVIPVAASLAALLLNPGITRTMSDPHWSAAPDDVDLDGLTHAEEILLARSINLCDSDNNGIIDGIDESLLMSALIASLPHSHRPDGPYVIDYEMDGLEQCAVCGLYVNMGFAKIVHPVRGLDVDIPYIGLHYLEHGNIGYDGTVHSGRVDVKSLKRILFPSNPSHILEAELDDTDSDHVEDIEEPLVTTNPADPDSDDDSLIDGSQIAEDLVAALSELPRQPIADGPYLLEHPLRGLETCTTCGERVNMGTVEIVNPLEGISLELPYIAIHYLAHGSYGYSGNVHTWGRSLPTVISTVLNGDGNAHWLYVYEDGDSDYLKDIEEVELGLDPGNPDTDGDGTPDGPETAVLLHDAVAGLPEGPLPDQTYVIHNYTFGLYQCLVCGEQINMGFMDIVNPVSGESTTLSYYNNHFMMNGSFSTDRPGIYPRKNPQELAAVLGIDVTDIEIDPEAADRVFLSNSPNPFPNSTEIRLGLPGNQEVTVSIFDAAGRKVCDVFTGSVSRGKVFVWDGRDAAGHEVASGVYFCKVKMGSMTLSKKMMRLQ